MSPNLSPAQLTARISFLLAAALPGPTAWAQLGTPLQTTRILNRNGISDAAPDGPVSLASTANGFVLAAWSTTDAVLGLGGDTDVVFQVSRDNGATWALPSTFSGLFAVDGAATDVEVRVGSRTNNYMAVWASNRNSPNGTHGIFSAFGVADGSSWVNVFPVDVAHSLDTVEDRRPAIASSGGTWVVVWDRVHAPGDTDIWFSRTTLNGGSSWSTDVPLQTNAATDAGMDTDARIASDSAGRWMCVWTSEDALGGTIGTDPDVLLSISSNDGLTWSAPTALDPAAATDGARDLFPTVAYDSTSSTWIVAWSSDVGQGGPLGDDMEIYSVRSTNGGLTWSAKTLLNSNAAVDPSSDGHDLHVEVVSDLNGRFLATWDRRDPTGTDLDVVAARSDDAGVTWTAPVRLKSTDASDVDEDRLPVIAATPQGHVVYAWSSNDTLAGTIGADGDLLHTRNMIPKSNLGLHFCFGSAETGNPSVCPCGNDAAMLAYSGCRNSTGLGARTSVNSNTSVSLPQAFISSSGVIPGGPVLFFEGTNAINQGYGVSFGDGLRCVGGAVRRLGVATSMANGSASLAFSTSGQIVGATRYYQSWYRDTGAVCGGGFFNLASAHVRVWAP